jgi:ComF family protein
MSTIFEQLLLMRTTLLTWCGSFYAILQDIASPAHCSHCWKLLEERVALCSHCTSLLRPIVSHELVINSTKTCVVHALSSYEEPLTSLIRAKQARLITSSYHVGQLMANRQTSLVITENDILVPIPLHWQRYAWRGFNQAEIIAEVIARKHGATVVPLLKRAKKTHYQAETRSKEERQTNVQEAFTWNTRYNPQDYTHKRVILVDDLMTTGATLRVAINELYNQYKKTHATPPAIHAYVAARVLIR